MKKNNKGLTLVELLVTVTILAIIVLPLLRGFVISAHTNAKAKEKLRTTEIAQNIMEGLKSNSLEDISRQFNYPGTANKDFKVFTNVVSTSETSEFLNKETDSTKKPNYEKAKFPSEGGIPDYVTNPDDLINFGYTSSYVCATSRTPAKFVGQSSHHYYFGVSNIASDAGNYYYDALISITPSTVDSGTAIEIGSDKKSINEFSLISANKINNGRDAISVVTKNNQEVMTAIKNKQPTLNESDISRCISIDIRQYNDGSKDYQMVTVSYEYSWNGGVYPSNATEESELTDVIFENSLKPEAVLESIYLFYEPWYSSKAGHVTDKIQIVNHNDIDVNVIIAKQETDDTDLLAKENGYKVNVDVIETVLLSDHGTNTAIYTNLNKNIKDQTEVTGGQANWSVNGVVTTEILTGVGTSGATTLVDKVSGERLFDVKVDIYPAGAFANKFADVEPITTITGGMTN